MERRDAFSVLEGGVATTAAPSVASVRTQVITSKTVSDPAELARILTDFRNELDRVRKQTALPFTGGVLVRAVSLAIGVNIIAHKLGRNPRDIFVTVTTVASAITIATLPTGYDPSQYVAINSTAATVGSLLVT